jgi:hypothetical protein
MIYDPNNELTEEQMKSLSEDEFFEYLDSKAEYLKKFSKPLDTYHLKQFNAADMGQRGEEITMDDLKRIKKLGKENELSTFDEEQSLEWKEKKHEMLKRAGVKNVKTHRSQWFD